MRYYEVAPNRIVRPGQDTFTYASEESLSNGTIVSIEVGKTSMVGVVMRATAKPTYVTKPITSVIDPQPIPTQLVELAAWIADYYNTPLSLVFQSVLPAGVQKSRRSRPQKIPQASTRNRTQIVFNDEQRDAISLISSSDPGTFFLHGVTGSGKTEVYIELAKQSIAAGKSVIILVPEIALTSQVVAELSHHFSDILVVHSTIGEAERHTIWKEALSSTSPRVVIGARSALFTPLRDIGLIVIDESHEPSYKQEQAPRYSALRAATILGRLHEARVVFGSATPTISDLYMAQLAHRPVARLNRPARPLTSPPAISLVDMTKKGQTDGHRFLSKQLLDGIEQALLAGKQSLIFHNRRGSASSTLCQHCGWVAECPRCFLPLTLHTDTHTLRCHICNHTERVPTACPMCQHTDIIHKGVGTKLIESELQKRYPKARIARFDADNDTTQTVNARYKELYEGAIDIAIGTQVVAKGLDLPHLRMVGVIQADSGLALPDFGASERTFQLLAQVIGRVGRNEHASQVIVQSYQPTHPSIVYGLSQDYDAFYEQTIADRQRSHFPPFTHLLKLVCTYSSESAAIKASQSLARVLRQHIHTDVTILGPTPAFYERQRDNYRWQLVLKSPRREHLIAALTHVPATHWQTELDPTSLL